MAPPSPASPASGPAALPFFLLPPGVAVLARCAGKAGRQAEPYVAGTMPRVGSLPSCESELRLLRAVLDGWLGRDGMQHPHSSHATQLLSLAKPCVPAVWPTHLGRRLGRRLLLLLLAGGLGGLGLLLGWRLALALAALAAARLLLLLARADQVDLKIGVGAGLCGERSGKCPAWPNTSIPCPCK